jgi:mRNA-degrading endonuclease RelE of RelBE toxin-antitoxin system
MPEVELSPRFIKSYTRLPKEIQGKIDKAIKLLTEDPGYPSLHSKPVEGGAGIFEARVDRQYRLTFQRLPGDVLFLRVVGKHDETLMHP